jgi:trimethylamine monooxygenase
MFDSQAWYGRDWVLGKFDLPSEEDKEKHFESWREREATLASVEDCIRYQMDYVSQLVNATDYPNWEYEKTINAFMEWIKHKNEDIMTFRDKPHTSVFTGTVSPVHHTVWKDAMDDSMESYMQTTEK